MANGELDPLRWPQAHLTRIHPSIRARQMAFFPICRERAIGKIMRSSMRSLSKGRLFMRVSRFASLLLLFFLPCQAFAWGTEGHTVIAAVAAQRLTPAAKQQIETLLGPHPEAQMVSVASWADEIRTEHPETKRFHFVDIPLDSSGYDAGRDCKDGKCIVDAIRDNAAKLQNTALQVPARAEALKWLIHLIGDIHQPLHCADNHDFGGNKVKVVVGDRIKSLHAVWDDDVVTAIAPNQTAMAASVAAMITPEFQQRVSLGPPAAWANESWSVARSSVYGPLSNAGKSDDPILLPSDYLKNSSRVAQTQLATAAFRLASVLNTLLP